MERKMDGWRGGAPTSCWHEAPSTSAVWMMGSIPRVLKKPGLEALYFLTRFSPVWMPTSPSTRAVSSFSLPTITLLKHWWDLRTHCFFSVSVKEQQRHFLTFCPHSGGTWQHLPEKHDLSSNITWNITTKNLLVTYWHHHDLKDQELLQQSMPKGSQPAVLNAVQEDGKFNTNSGFLSIQPIPETKIRTNWH